MQKLLLLLFMVIAVSPAGAQINRKKLQKADKYLERQDFELAIPVYKEQFDEAEKSDPLYQQLLTGYSRSLYYAGVNQANISNWPKVLEYGKLYLDAVKLNIRLVAPEDRPHKYNVCQQMVLAYFTMGYKDSAQEYRDMLYEGYKEIRLPTGMGTSFNFERFEYDNMNVVAYESFASPHDKDNRPDYAKFIYNVYARGPRGQNATLLFSVKAVPYNKVSYEDPDLVLARSTYMNNREISDIIGAVQYTLPIDYDKLHYDVIEVIKGNYKVTGRTVNKM